MVLLRFSVCYMLLFPMQLWCQALYMKGIFACLAFLKFYYFPVCIFRGMW